MLNYLAEIWDRLFEWPLPLKYPVWTAQIPMIRRCIKKKDATEMIKWLEKKEKERIANGEIW